MTKDCCVLCRVAFDQGTLELCEWHTPEPVNGQTGLCFDTRSRGYICDDCREVHWAKPIAETT